MTLSLFSIVTEKQFTFSLKKYTKEIIIVLKSLEFINAILSFSQLSSVFWEHESFM